MRTVSIFRNNRNQAVRLPRDFEFPADVTELIIERHGDTITLRPARPDWASFFDLPMPEGADDFLRERPEIMDQDRFAWMRGGDPK